MGHGAVRDGAAQVATQTLLAAWVIHCRLSGDLLDLLVREQFRAFKPVLTEKRWDDYLAECRGRDPGMPQWNESTC